MSSVVIKMCTVMADTLAWLLSPAAEPQRQEVARHANLVTPHAPYALPARLNHETTIQALRRDLDERVLTFFFEDMYWLGLCRASGLHTALATLPAQPLQDDALILNRFDQARGKPLEQLALLRAHPMVIAANEDQHRLILLGLWQELLWSLVDDSGEMKGERIAVWAVLSQIGQLATGTTLRALRADLPVRLDMLTQHTVIMPGVAVSTSSHYPPQPFRELSGKQREVLQQMIALRRHHPSNPEAWLHPSNATIARAVGITTNSTRTHRKQLEFKGYACTVLDVDGRKAIIPFWDYTKARVASPHDVSCYMKQHLLKKQKKDEA